MVEAKALRDTLVEVQPKVLVDMLAYKLVEMDGETLVEILSDVLAKILVDTLAHRLLQVEVVTRGKKKNQAVVDMPEHASRVAARDV